VAEDHEQMCATDARNVYDLNKKDLKALQFELVPNPYDLYNTKTSMKLYTVSDLRVSTRVPLIKCFDQFVALQALLT
jgi:hypothetical protein